jgi:hypothetical protein
MGAGAGDVGHHGYGAPLGALRTFEVLSFIGCRGGRGKCLRLLRRRAAAKHRLLKVRFPQGNHRDDVLIQP